MHTKVTIPQILGYFAVTAMAGVALGLAIGFVLTDVIGLH